MSFVNDGVRYQTVKDNRGVNHTFPATDRDVERLGNRVSETAENVKEMNVYGQVGVGTVFFVRVHEVCPSRKRSLARHLRHFAPHQ